LQVGHGYRVMSVDEWSSRWKPNDAWPECLQCGSKNTKEHYFIQTWCRGKKKWESECLCLDCHSFSFRSYCDPDFKTPEDAEKERWQVGACGNGGPAAPAPLLSAARRRQEGGGCAGEPCRLGATCFA
jgi:hypothetical protein